MPNIAIPPPRGITVRWYLSWTGWATSPARMASLLATIVKINDSANDPANRIIANMINVSILTAPLIGF